MIQLFGRKKKGSKAGTPEECYEEFLGIMRESTEYTGEILPDNHLFYDLGLSSMEIMILIGDLEDQLGKRLEISRLKTVKTVEDLYKVAYE